MKAFLTALALTASATTTVAADCPVFESEYTLHWRSYASEERSLSGRPTQAYAFASGNTDRNLRDEATVEFHYSGLVRRFQFDSPSVLSEPAETGGQMVIQQNLLAPYEMTQTELHFQQPVAMASLEIHGVDQGAAFDRGYSDQVSIVGLTAGGLRSSLRSRSTTSRHTSSARS